MPDTKTLIFPVSFAGKSLDLHVEFDLDGEPVPQVRLWHEENAEGPAPQRFTTWSGGSRRDDDLYATNSRTGPDGNAIGLQASPYTAQQAIDRHIAVVFESSIGIAPDQHAAFGEHIADPMIAGITGLAEDTRLLREISDGTRLRVVAAWHKAPSSEAPRWTIPSRGLRFYVVV